jgi:hypothetical protein
MNKLDQVDDEDIKRIDGLENELKRINGLENEVKKI